MLHKYAERKKPSCLEKYTGKGRTVLISLNLVIIFVCHMALADLAQPDFPFPVGIVCKLFSRA